MEPASLGALRQYQIARQAITPEAGQAPGTANPTETKASPIVQGVQEFAEVFENVESTTQAYAAGQGDAHSVVEALASAEAALETAVVIRNRVVEAYQELLRMPV